MYILSVFSSSKCSLFHNSDVFGSCIIHILYIYSTNIGTEYFKHGVFTLPSFFSSKCSLFYNSNLFGSCIFHILYTECAKIKSKNSGAKSLPQYVTSRRWRCSFLAHANVPPAYAISLFVTSHSHNAPATRLT